VQEGKEKIMVLPKQTKKERGKHGSKLRAMKAIIIISTSEMEEIKEGLLDKSSLLISAKVEERVFEQARRRKNAKTEIRIG